MTASNIFQDSVTFFMNNADSSKPMSYEMYVLHSSTRYEPQ